MFSAALCRGLIEAASVSPCGSASRARFPRLYAAASLKRAERETVEPPRPLFSAALCRGLIEAKGPSSVVASSGSFPRLYAAASLKPGQQGADHGVEMLFSAALCRGLIEAPGGRPERGGLKKFSAALCRGLIEATPGGGHIRPGGGVFRGFMPRPH